MRVGLIALGATIAIGTFVPGCAYGAPPELDAAVDAPANDAPASDATNIDAPAR